ncbi:MAG: hypothetical protein U1F29_00515 [Planctomycetota bacterium]
MSCSHRSRIVGLVVAAASTVSLALARPFPQSCETLRVSRASTPLASSATLPALSGDGRYVAFLSSASNLVANDTNGVADVFLWDATTRTIERVSVSSTGAQATWASGAPNGGRCVSVSADARYVAFDCVDGALDPASLAPTATWSDPYLYVRDRQLGTTTRYGSGLYPDLSADGHLLAFVSGAFQLYVRDLTTGALTHASVTNGGATLSDASGASNWHMGGPEFDGFDLSANGRFVAFHTYAAELFPPPNYTGGVAVRDLVLATTTALGDGDFFFPVVADDGTVVAAEFPAAGGSLVAYAPPSYAPSALYAPSGVGGFAVPGGITPDGRYVAFGNTAPNVWVPDANGSIADVLVVDRTTGALRLSSQSDSSAQGNAASVGASISDDGARVAFTSSATNLVASDGSAAPQVFLRACVDAPSVLCPGDGTATPCPCGNSGASGHGCASSSNAAGAWLVANGVASAFADTLSLASSGTTNGVVLFVQSTEAQNGGLGVPLGDGVLCVGGSILRLGTMQASGGLSQYPNVGQASISVRGQIPPGGGVTRVYQARYRNSASFCTPDTFNLSNAIAIEWLP